ncbi:MAG: hypothetical protein R6W31_18465 [Bacteroidales bacterium]
MVRNLPVSLLLILLISSCTGKKDDLVETGSSLFNAGWEFRIDSIGLPESMKWEKVSLPHTAHIEPLVVNNQWQGDCWYRKTFSYNPGWQGKKLFLRFEGAMNVAEVWINGNKKMTHSGGYLPFVVDITEDIRGIESNTIDVKLNNEDNPETGPKPLPTLDFNMYGGLYRDVFLVVKNKVHITDAQFANQIAGGGVFVTYPEVTNEKAIVSNDESPEAKRVTWWPRATRPSVRSDANSSHGP